MKKTLIIAGTVSLVLLVLALLTTRARDPLPGKESERDLLARSALKMQECLDTLANVSGKSLIGPELSGIVTTAGDLQAKRTTLNPAFASLVAMWLREAGLKEGDSVAIACSGSFPALMIASVAAVQELGLHGRVILSAGSSSFGASDPLFSIYDQWRILETCGLFRNAPVGLSAGGDRDAGEGFEGPEAADLLNRMRSSGIPFITAGSLTENVKIRDSLYTGGKPGSIKAFINCGGSYSSLGTGPEILRAKPGLIRKAPMPPPDQQGMVHHMLRNGVPVIHLLNIRELARRYNLPWDPAGRIDPDPESLMKSASKEWLIPSILVLAAYIGFLAGLMLLDNSRRKAG